MSKVCFEFSHHLCQRRSLSSCYLGQSGRLSAVSTLTHFRVMGWSFIFTGRHVLSACVVIDVIPFLAQHGASKRA